MIAKNDLKPLNIKPFKLLYTDFSSDSITFFLKRKQSVVSIEIRKYYSDVFHLQPIVQSFNYSKIYNELDGLIEKIISFFSNHPRYRLGFLTGQTKFISYPYYEDEFLFDHSFKHFPSSSKILYFSSVGFTLFLWVMILPFILCAFSIMNLYFRFFYFLESKVKSKKNKG